MGRWLRNVSNKAKTAILVLSLLTAQIAGAAAPLTAADPVNNVNANPPGNNGTIKVDGNDLGNGPDNDPHVGCTFDIAWWNYDQGDLDATVDFELQAPTTPPDNTMTVTGDTTPSFHSDGTALVLDHTEDYTLAFTGAPQKNQGYHVKLTVTTPYSQGNDTKSKVFWVTGCSSTPTINTQASPSSIKLGQSVTDTATLSGLQGAVSGTVKFYVCGPEATNPDCTTGGSQVGSDVTVANDEAVSSSFTPSAIGHYCFRAEYTPDQDAAYNAVSHTNQTTECFTVTTDVVTPPTGTITVKKVLFPATDTGKFNLQIDGSTAGTGANVGDGGTTGAVVVATGNHTVDETAGTSTTLSDYDSTYSCDNGVHGTGTTVPAFNVAADEDVVCTFTNQKHTIPQVLGDTTTTPTIPTPTSTTPAVLGAELTNTGLPVGFYTLAAMTLLGSAVYVISRRKPNLG